MMDNLLTIQPPEKQNVRTYTGIHVYVTHNKIRTYTGIHVYVTHNKI